MADVAEIRAQGFQPPVLEMDTKGRMSCNSDPLEYLKRHSDKGTGVLKFFSLFSSLI